MKKVILDDVPPNPVAAYYAGYRAAINALREFVMVNEESPGALSPWEKLRAFVRRQEATEIDRSMKD